MGIEVKKSPGVGGCTVGADGPVAEAGLGGYGEVVAVGLAVAEGPF